MQTHSNQALLPSAGITSAGPGRRRATAVRLRRASATLLVATLGIVAPTLALRAGSASAPSTVGARCPVPALMELTGRFERANSPGGYVDVHGPLGVYEALHACRYRDAEGRPIDAGR